MKKLISILLVTSILVLAALDLFAGEIKGGLIDLNSETINIIEEVSDSNILIGRKISKKEEGKSRGSLFVITVSNEEIELKRDILDRKGVTIKAPRNSFDKVVYLDNHNNILGGFGLTNEDVSSLVSRNMNTFSKVYETYSEIKDIDTVKDKFASIQLASRIFETDMNEEDQIDIFESTMKMLTGYNFASIVREIANSSEILESIPNISASLEELQPIACGIFLEESDNNVPIIVQGFKEVFDIPEIPYEDLNINGITLLRLD